MKKMAALVLGTTLFLGAGTSLGGVYLANAEKKQENVIECVQFEKANMVHELQTCAKASYLMDFASETVMHAQNERERLPIASMCKIMTLLLSFEAIFITILFPKRFLLSFTSIHIMHPNKKSAFYAPLISVDFFATFGYTIIRRGVLECVTYGAHYTVIGGCLFFIVS